ncbi:MAG: glycoside hydrolase family 127 protein [Alistipes sp.]|nr:glycoside hydrolase family 127 protein [Alistipes sp.]
MKKLQFLSLAALALCACQNQKIEREVEPLTPMSFEKVTLEDDFWLPRLKIQKETLVPFSLEKTRFSVENLRRVGQYLKGEKVTKPFEGALFVASDLFKVMEGAAYLLILEKDEALEAQMDEIIDIIASAQAADGYLYEHHILPEHLRNQGNYWGTGHKPYSKVVYSHELYNMGHMYEGAVAYYQATGKRKWLDVAEKNAQHVNRVFFEGDPAYNDGKPIMQAPGHQEIELALVKMYRVTGNKLYAEMAKKFVDIRGTEQSKNGAGAPSAEYCQAHVPVREQHEAVGHSVRATYLYSGMADVAAMCGDTTLMPALNDVWHDIVDRKMHINGGLGAVPGIEGFGPAYDLPNMNTYDETCAAVGNVFFNYRMFLASGEAKYVDVAEVALYNNVLAGVNLEGNKFFYVNVLEADGRRPFNHGTAGRAPWFGTACCPSNMARLIPQISGMTYSHSNDDIYTAFYAANSTVVPLEAGNVALKQTTDYPFDGKITIEVTPEQQGTEFTMWLRIPTWCGEQFVPGELYSYTDNHASKVVAKVNGKRVRAEVVDGYMPVQRAWQAGDKVELELPMPVRYSVADERVKADINRVCVTRGPLVYCAEQPDNEHKASMYILSNVAQRGEVATFDEGVMAGIDNITLNASVLVDDGSEEMAVEYATLKLIPYYAWNNRGDNMSMNVWFARDKQTAYDGNIHTVGNIRDVKATHTWGSDDVYAVADGKHPKHSFDTSIPRWTSYDEVGKEQVVEVALRKKQPVESVSVYWYDDKRGVHLPESWSMEYKDGDEWKVFQPYITDRFGVEPNQFNMVHPEKSIQTQYLRLKIKPKSYAAVGILELIVE